MLCGYCRFVDNAASVLNNSNAVIHIIHENLDNSSRVNHSIHKTTTVFFKIKGFFSKGVMPNLTQGWCWKNGALSTAHKWCI
jgi:hypothetical protein